MSTATEDVNVNDDLDLDLAPPDMDSMEDYQKGATDPNANLSKKPTPGAYTLRMPQELPDEAFELKAAKDGKPAYLQITLDNRKRGDEGEGLTIVEGPYAGESARFLRVTTQQRRLTRYDRTEQKSVPVVDEKTGEQRYYNDALDLLARFGVKEIPKTKAQWIEAFRALEGKVIPGEVYLGWQGRERGRKVEGYDARIYQKAFKRVDGSWSARKECVAETAFTHKVKGKDVTVNPGEKYTVFADLVLGVRAFPSR